MAKVDRHTGKMLNGPEQEFKCYSAVTERYPSVRRRYWANFDAVRGKTPDGVLSVLSSCFPPRAELVRIHTAGDFFNQAYFDGWLLMASSMPSVRFYAFTKSLPYWLARLDSIPPNLVLQASYGGRYDELIENNGLKFAKVVRSKCEADAMGLLIDTNDSMAAVHGPSFALLENFTAKGKGQSENILEKDLFSLDTPPTL